MNVGTIKGGTNAGWRTVRQAKCYRCGAPKWTVCLSCANTRSN